MIVSLRSEHATTGDSLPLRWMDFHEIVRLSATERNRLRRETGISDQELREVERVDRDVIYRVPVHYRAALQDGDYRIVGDPPFRFIDPDISVRHLSQDLRVWMSGYKDALLVEKILFALAERFPDITRLETIGQTHEGRPILALKIARNPAEQRNRPTVLLAGAHHGNEPLSVDYVLDFAYFLLYGTPAFEEEEGVIARSFRETFYRQTNAVGTEFFRQREHEDILDNFVIWCVPLVNADGLDSFWYRNVYSGRKNARDTTAPPGWNKEDGVDLNRNYPYQWDSGYEGSSSGEGRSLYFRGPTPASEPEVAAIMQLAERERFALALSFHCYATKILVPYTAEEATNPRPHVAWRLGQQLARAGISNRPDRDYVAVKNLYAVDGTDQDFLFHRYGTLAFIVEGSYLSPDYEPFGRLSIRGVRPIILRALQAFREGPVVTVYTTDEESQPLTAVVTIEEYDYYEGESFETRPRTGRFDFLLERPGVVTVQANRDGYLAARQRVQCNGGACEAHLKLTPVSSR